MRNESKAIKAGHTLEAVLLTFWALSLGTGFALGWVAYFWCHRG